MRLIDADKLRDGFDNRIQFIIDHAPTIDAVPVVRCKDCFWRKKNTFCLKQNRYAKDDFFCAHGEPFERRMDGEENAAY